jgi:hypothetical protein
VSDRGQTWSIVPRVHSPRHPGFAYAVPANHLTSDSQSLCCDSPPPAGRLARSAKTPASCLCMTSARKCSRVICVHGPRHRALIRPALPGHVPDLLPHPHADLPVRQRPHGLRRLPRAHGHVPAVPRRAGALLSSTFPRLRLGSIAPMPLPHDCHCRGALRLREAPRAAGGRDPEPRTGGAMRLDLSGSNKIGSLGIFSQNIWFGTR